MNHSEHITKLAFFQLQGMQGWFYIKKLTCDLSYYKISMYYLNECKKAFDKIQTLSTLQKLIAN